MLRRPVRAALLTALLLAACGGSSHSKRSSSSTTSATSTVSAGPSTTTTNTTTSTTSARPPEVPKNRAPKHSKPTAPDTNVRIPAMFVIRAGGAVTPPLISVPPKVTIELQLHNEDTKAHSVTLSVPRFGGVAAPAHATTTTDVTGVPKGTYRLLVDGASRARIVVGAVPGP